MSQRPRPRPLPSLAQFFERQLAQGGAVSFCLPGGTPLFKAGEAADQLYFLKTGRLVAHVGDAHPRTVTVHPGETVGEISVIAGARFSVTVVALRDSELLAVPRSVFLDETHCDADFLVELSRLVLARSRETPGKETAVSRGVFALVALTPGVNAYLLADQLNQALRRLGHTSVALAADAGPTSPEWFARIERSNDFVLYSVEHDEPGWRALVARQADGLIYIGDGAVAPSDQFAPLSGAHWSVASDLVLIQKPDLAAPAGAAAWTDALEPARLFHVRRGRQGDIDRLARALAGTAVGLVLSGGAARAYAHVGAIQVLRESGTPIDFIGGVSMGAIIGAGLAMGWDDADLDARVRAAFVDSSPVGDVTWPIVAISRGDRVRERLARHFGDRAICDLWLPFFCVSTNLTTGSQHIHRRGLVRDALRASLSLPGLLPPVACGDDVLVDGAVLNNFPADIMRSFHNGPIVGVDVGAGRGITASDIIHPESIVRWLSSGAWHGGAPIVSVLIRSATVMAYHQIAVAHEATDVLIEPKLDDIDMGNWKAYDLAVERGRSAAVQALAALAQPIAELRHLASGAE